MQHEEFQDKVLESLTRLETQMYSLVGNGQPGRIKEIENDVEEVKTEFVAAKNRMYGIVTGISIVIAGIGALIHFVFKY